MYDEGVPALPREADGEDLRGRQRTLFVTFLDGKVQEWPCPDYINWFRGELAFRPGKILRAVRRWRLE